MDSKPLNVAVVGVGYLGQFHAEKYAAIPDVKLIGVVDSDRGRGNEIAKKLNTHWFSDPSDLIGKVDAVSIVVPTAYHHEVAVAFLKNGVHVLLEKPISVTLDQADELIALAGQNKVTLQIGHIERFNPAITAIKTLLKSPRFMVTERSAPFTVRCTDVNVILDLMIHDLDIVTDIAGSRPKEVAAAGASLISKEIDIATARIVFENGCIADITASRVSDEKKRVLRVFDGELLYTADYQLQKATVTSRGGTVVPECSVAPLETERKDTLKEEIQHFLLNVRSGSRPMVSGAEGRMALALAQLVTDLIQKKISGFVPVR